MNQKDESVFQLEFTNFHGEKIKEEISQHEEEIMLNNINCHPESPLPTVGLCASFFTELSHYLGAYADTKHSIIIRINSERDQA